MSRPIDVIRCFHNAFRRDSSQIDSSVFRIVKKGEDLTPFFVRLQIIGEILDYHARGEEAAVFPAVERLTPFVAQAYLIDHRELDNMIGTLKEISKAPDPLTVARAAAVLESHLRIHLNKEDVHLYPILRERTSDEEQASILKVMSSKVPPERFPLLIQWLFPPLELEDQITVTRTWMSIMPTQVFANAKPLIKNTLAEKWTEITSQIPELSDN